MLDKKTYQVIPRLLDKKKNPCPPGFQIGLFFAFQRHLELTDLAEKHQIQWVMSEICDLVI